MIAGHLAKLGMRSEILPMREGLARLSETWFDVLTINALAFTMTQHEKYAPLRSVHAFAISDAEKATIRGHLASGGKLLGLHTAAICFDDWPEWQDYLGIAWQWGTSHHPPPCTLRIDAEEPFETVDELYCDLALASGTEVLANATCRSVDRPQPILLRNANAVYLALGHDETACENAGFVRLLTDAAQNLLSSIEKDA